MKRRVSPCAPGSPCVPGSPKECAREFFRVQTQKFWHFFGSILFSHCSGGNSRPSWPSVARAVLPTSEAERQALRTEGAVDGPAYYSYTVPQPPGIENEAIRPAAASWNPEVSEFILMYDDVRRAESPEQALYEFLESTYDAGARLAKWDRASLEV